MFRKKNEEYIFYKNGEKWLHAIDGKEFKIAKAVYCTFTDTSLSLFDNSWDIKYLDGNPENCHVDNIVLK